MNRRTLCSSLVAMLLFMAMAFENGSAPALASVPFNEQQVRWCSTNCYTVKVDAAVGCTPSVRTSWNGGAVTWPAPISSFYGPGTTTTVCPVPIQPVGTVLDWVNVCGTILPGLQGQYSIPAGGCGCPALCVQLCTNATGCLTIFVSPISACSLAPKSCP